MKKIFIIPLLIIFLLGFSGISGGTPINQVPYASLTGSGLVTFDDIPGGWAPGTNYDAIIKFYEADFGERFVGQTLLTSGDFDILSGSPTGPLSLAAGAPNQNLNVFLATSGGITSQVLAGLGPKEYPNFKAIGEGSIAVLFHYDQSDFGFRILGGNEGDAYLSFFRRDGSLIQDITLSGLSNSTFYGFQREGGIKDIGGISIYNTDPGGIAFDSFIDDVPAGAGQSAPEPATLILLGSGLLGLAGFRRKFKK
ncbi:MAG: PEP-CTERM sorting domain-containing protein [Deltaproteobacteria bacterium]|nr:PEP-CTERM sorting domain-containing protein [Deltaproteobacteria bacterium]